MTHRPYREHADLLRMTRLLAAGLAESANGCWHRGDLEWKMFRPPGFPVGEVFELWEDGDALAGFVALSGGTFDYQCARERRGSSLEGEMAEWAQRAVLSWRAANGLEASCSIECWDDDRYRIDLLASMGYQRTDRGAVIFRRSLDDPIPRVARTGFEVRGLREHDIESRAITQRQAFAPGSTTTPASWRHLRSNAPGYEPDLDSVAVTSDGTVVAAALAWLDEANLVGAFEPVGTRPDYQRLGLAQACLLRGLRKMRERGMTEAIVSTSNANTSAIATYHSVGCEISARVTEFELTRPPRGSSSTSGR